MIRSAHGRAAITTESGAARKGLLDISRKLSATIGSEFFQAIARHLAEALAADGVIVAEFAGGHMERCRSVGAWCDGSAATIEYELAESAVAQVLLGKPCQWRSHVRSRFPSDALLSRMSAEAYVAVPLLEEDGVHPLGALMAVYRRPVTSLRFPKAVLELFAERAAAELVRKLEDDKIRETEQRYRAFIAKNADAMWRVEFEQPISTSLPAEEQLDRIYKYGYLAECNDATAHLLGLQTASQVIGARVAEVAPRDSVTRDANLAAIRSGYRMTTVETDRIDESGKRRCLLRSQWGIVEDGQLQRIWGAHRDITELRHVELALDASEQRMADLVESMRLFVLFLDLKGTIEFCNNYLLEITGWPADELIGKDWLKAIVPAGERDRVEAELERNTPERPGHFESGLLKANGSLQIEWDSTVLRNSDGHAAARAMVGRNITEQKSLQDQVLQAQKLAGIGRLAGGLAHDFNNLLTVILGYTSKLLDEVKPSDTAFSSLIQIQKAAERSADLAHRLLTFSRREIFRPQVIGLNRLVEEVRSWTEALAGGDVKLILSLDPELKAVRVDPTQFHQLVMNLAANARDAMPQGGLLTIATSNFTVDGTEPHPAGIPPGEFVLMTVADTGTGMTDEVRSHLFEPFFTTKDPGKGTGLGLAMVYGIVQQSSGYIRVDTEPGRGTTFRIFLPVVSSAEMPQAPKPRRPLPRGTETVLLVEDPQVLGEAAAKILSSLGYTVMSADGPLQAIEMSRAKANTIQLLVSPAVTNGMPGAVLLDMVKESQPKTKALFVSSDGEESSVAENAPGITFDILSRPFSRKSLALKVREILDRE